MHQPGKGGNMAAFFVTGTGTGIGKTYVTAGILRAAPGACAIKPVLSGYDPADAAGSDAGILLAAMGKKVTPENIAAIAPWRFAAPLSPDMAAAREGRRIDLGAVVTFCRAAMAAAPGLLLVEGVGGAMVPLNGRKTVRDWVGTLQIPVILVAGTYLGTISHTLTTAKALTIAGIRIAAVVLSESMESPVAAEETAAVIERFLAVPVKIIPRELNDRSFRELAAFLTTERPGAAPLAFPSSIVEN
jgi:dethiobiotin synthetase